MNKIIVFSLVAAAVFLAPILLATEVQAVGSKGLRVFLNVNTNFNPQPVEINTFQFGNYIMAHDSYIDNGITEIELNYEKGEIVNGEFEVCVLAVHANMESCGYGYDGKEKEPVYDQVDLFGSFAPQPIENNQGQSSNENSNEYSNAQSQSVENNIYICNDGVCKKQ